MQKKKVGIIGVSGYTGLCLLKILLAHPRFELSYLANSQGQMSLSAIHPQFLDVLDMDIHKADVLEAKKCDVLFLALPHKSAMEFVKKLYASGDSLPKIVDLSADYRLSAQNYEATYCPHTDKENLANAIYGLPEYASEQIKNANLVANPGCYPTASLLALLPFLPYIQSDGVFIDAKSGVSGAGKKLTDDTHFPNINENLFTYSPFTHRHQIEIEEKCALFGQVNLQINFVPHLTPLTRGMLVSVFATLKDSVDEDFEPLELLKSHYANSQFIRISQDNVRISNVSGSNMCDILALRRGRALFINSAIDNLMRGASSQAVVNANIMCGFPEDCGIPKVGI